MDGRDERERTGRPREIASAYNGDAVLARLSTAVQASCFRPDDRSRVLAACHALRHTLDRCTGRTLQERWADFERSAWPEWVAGRERPSANWWTGGVRVAVTARLVQPSWALLRDAHLPKWLFLPNAPKR